MSWTVNFTKKAAKQTGKLPENVRDTLVALVRDIQDRGPVRGEWSNYSKLAEKGHHHCHLAYRYVACWSVVDDKVQIVEVYYVGSREKAPY